MRKFQQKFIEGRIQSDPQNIYERFKAENLKSRLIIQIHDELVFDVYKPELDVLKPIIEKHMQNALPLKVPVEVGMGTGVNWLEAH